MSQLFIVFLVLHVVAAIAAFGPGFANPIITSLARNQPQHGLFTLRILEAVEYKVTVPLALTMPVTGVGLIWAGGIDLFKSTWLLIAIVLYVIAILFAVLVQGRTIRRMIAILESAPAGGPPTGGPPTGGPPAGGPPVGGPPAGGPPAGGPPAGGLPAGGPPRGGPPPEFIALSQRAARGGMFLGLLVISIVSLMVWRPVL